MKKFLVLAILMDELGSDNNFVEGLILTVLVDFLSLHTDTVKVLPRAVAVDCRLSMSNAGRKRSDSTIVGHHPSLVNVS